MSSKKSGKSKSRSPSTGRDNKRPQPQEQPQAEVSEPEVVETEQDQRAEVDALRDQLLRLHADFDNYRKRQQREQADWYRQANEDLAAALLPVLDHFEIGLKSAEQHKAEESVRQGFRMVYEQMLDVLRKFGLEGMEVDGQPFDPHLHEAVTCVPSDEHPDGSIVAQTRRGYMLNGKLIRPAQVVVSSGPPEAVSRQEEESNDG